jgi:hypothetical protein
MKKYASLLALVLVVALAMPAGAAFSFTGRIDGGFYYKHNEKTLTPNMRIRLYSQAVNTADPNKVYMPAAVWLDTTFKWDTFTASAYGKAWSTTQIPYNTYIQFKGAYTTGGPEVTTKVGYLGAISDIYSEKKNDYLSKELDLYNPAAKHAKWIPELSDSQRNTDGAHTSTIYMKGVSITGGKLMGADLNLYYMQPVENANYFIAVARKDQFTNRLGYRFGTTTEDGNYRNTFDVNKYPLTDDLKVYGYVDYNDLEQVNGKAQQRWKLGGEYTVDKDTVIDGFYRHNNTYDVNGTFKVAAGENLKPTVVVGYKDVLVNDEHADGIYASVMTDVANVKLGAKYDDALKTTYLVAGDMYSTFDDYVELLAEEGDETSNELYRRYSENAASNLEGPGRGQRETGNSYGAALILKDNDEKELRLGATQDLIKLMNMTSGAKLYARAGAVMDLNDTDNGRTWAQLYGQTDITTLPGLNKVTVHGRAHFESDRDEPLIGAGAIYTAPNGVRFEVGYNWDINGQYSNGRAYDDIKYYFPRDSQGKPTTNGFNIAVSKYITF